ncbi:MAG: hypothetical protein AAGD96_36190 [Chloroflexota bacterium]
MDCDRCQQPLSFLGSKSFSDNSPDTVLGALGELLPDHSELSFYLCESCGKIEFVSPPPPHTPITNAQDDPSLANLGPAVSITPVPQDLDILLDHSGLRNPTDLNDLLKLVPGQSTLNDVYEKVGFPFAYHKIETAVVLCFRSAVSHHPHTILIDSIYAQVKLIAIHNDHFSFNLDNLETAYGHKEFVMREHGHEFWMFEPSGVAYLTQGVDDEEILYVQFFESRLDMNRYMELDGFFEETFMCDDAGRMDNARHSF